MSKYLVIFEVYASASVEVEAESEEEAQTLAAREVSPQVCHYCSDRVQIDDIGDVVEVMKLED